MLFGATYINYISTEKDREDNYYFHFLENRNERMRDGVMLGFKKERFLAKVSKIKCNTAAAFLC